MRLDSIEIVKRPCRFRVSNLTLRYQAIQNGIGKRESEPAALPSRNPLPCLWVACRVHEDGTYQLDEKEKEGKTKGKGRGTGIPSTCQSTR